MSDNLSPAQEAWFDYRKGYGSWPEPESAQVHKHFVAGYEAAVRAVRSVDEKLEWGVAHSDGVLIRVNSSEGYCGTEQEAQAHAILTGSYAVTRQVGPWERVK